MLTITSPSFSGISTPKKSTVSNDPKKPETLPTSPTTKGSRQPVYLHQWGMGLWPFKLIGKPKPVELVHVNIGLHNLPKELVDLKIAHLSDLHAHHDYGRLPKNYWENAIDKVVEAKPDVIVFTGDAVHLGSHFLTKATKLLSQLPKNTPKIAVLGNHDMADGQHGKGASQALKDAGFIVLEDSVTDIMLRGKRIRLLGAKDCCGEKGSLSNVLAKQSIQALREVLNKVRYHQTPADLKIGLVHHPDLAKKLKKNNLNAQLFLAGHTHGGHHQFKKEPLKGLYKWAKERFAFGTPKYNHKLYTIYGNRKLYVSGGMATHMQIKWEHPLATMPPIRFGMPPEIPILTLKQA
ncbi:MAG: metallophosphoesterase [Vampirovibrionales bacterium]|nr:metallophosphoesterase [Vampirovibrionales bacterium]